MQYIPDYNDLLQQKQLDEEQEADKLPECANCGEKIMTETCYEINGELICPECMQGFERWTEDYVE
jgi:formylmethanofuran dehydrogenase subunit E